MDLDLNAMLDDGERSLFTHDGKRIPCDQCGRVRGKYRPAYRVLPLLGELLVCDPCVAEIAHEWPLLHTL